MKIMCTNCVNADVGAGFVHEVVDGPYWTAIHPGCCDNVFSLYEVVQVSE